MITLLEALTNKVRQNHHYQGCLNERNLVVNQIPLLPLYVKLRIVLLNELFVNVKNGIYETWRTLLKHNEINNMILTSFIKRNFNNYVLSLKILRMKNDIGRKFPSISFFILKIFNDRT